MAAKTTTVDLEEPIVRGSETIDKLTLRKPHGGELRGLSMMDLARMDATAVAKVLPRITMPPLTAQEVDDLDATDRFALATEIASFFLSAKMRAEMETTTT